MRSHRIWLLPSAFPLLSRLRALWGLSCCSGAAERKGWYYDDAGLHRTKQWSYKQTSIK
jgi:hypothetical protein